ncbi:MAG: MoaD/ThiS family protein [Desulfurococcales archaeon]|nr:MoaD/ThiS family protein [Desulfurococcales archaeon]
MGSVKVRFYGALKHELGIEELEVDGSVRSLRDLLDAIVRELGDRAKTALFDESTGDLRTGLVVLINGSPASLSGGLDASVFEGDEVVLDRVEIIEVEGGG